METYAMALKARAMHEDLLTADTIERFGDAKHSAGYKASAVKKMGELAAACGFRLVPLTEQKEAA